MSPAGQQWRREVSRLPAQLREGLLSNVAARLDRERPLCVMHQRRRIQLCRRILRLWRIPRGVMAVLREATQHVVWTGAPMNRQLGIQPKEETLVAEWRAKKGGRP